MALSQIPLLYTFLSSLLITIYCFCPEGKIPPSTLATLVNGQALAFRDFKDRYDKKYKDSSEELYRNIVLFRNQKLITEHNLKKNSSYKMKLNQFGDLSEEEFRTMYATLITTDTQVKEFSQHVSEDTQLEQEDCFCKVDNQFRKLQSSAKVRKNKDHVIQRSLDFLSEKTRRKDLENDKKIKFQSTITTLASDERSVTLRHMNSESPQFVPIINTDDCPKQIVAEKYGRVNNPNETPSSNTKKVQAPHAQVSSGEPQIPISNPEQSSIPKQSAKKKAQATQNSNPNEQVTPSGEKSIDPKKEASIQSAPIIPNSLQDLFVNSQKQQENSPEELAPEITTEKKPTRLLQSTDLSIYNKDWTSYVGEARNQGRCGACYAFAAVQNLEALLGIYAFGVPVQLSVQQIIDCSGYTNMTLGCDGGFLEGPFVFLKNYGVVTDFAYPYVSGMTGKAQSCQSTSSFFKIKSYQELPYGDCMALRSALQTRPVSVAIASYRLMFYSSGVFNDCNTYIDHAVLLIGYNNTKGWKIKNSWGSYWGEDGFAWLADGNSCSLCNYAMTAKISMEPSP